MKGKRTKQQDAKRVQSYKAHKHAVRTLRTLRLPVDLITLLREDRLEAEVLKAYEDYDRHNALLDAWEIANPELYKLVPWYKGRERWKADGRPRPPWYQLLGEREPVNKSRPLSANDLDHKIYLTYNAANVRQWRAKQKAKKQGSST